MDGFGDEKLPYARPTDDTLPVGDPALGYLGQYLQAAVNAACEAIWDNLACPGRQTVKHLFFHDPKKLFDDLRLPAFYAWRGKATRKRVADDLYLKTTTIELAWIGEGAQEETLLTRDPVMNAIADAVDVALRNDSDRAWTLPGETDPVALINGTSISDACGFSRLVPTEQAAQEFIFQRIEDATPTPYYGFTIAVEADEYMAAKAKSAIPSKLNAKLSTNAAPSTATNVPIIIGIP